MRNIFDFFSATSGASPTTLAPGDVLRETSYSDQAKFWRSTLLATYYTTTDYVVGGTTYSSAQATLYDVVYDDAAVAAADGTPLSRTAYAAPVPTAAARDSMSHQATQVFYFGFENNTIPAGVVLVQTFSGQEEDGGNYAMHHYYNVMLFSKMAWMFSTPRALTGPSAFLGLDCHPVIASDRLTVMLSSKGVYGGMHLMVETHLLATDLSCTSTTTAGPYKYAYPSSPTRNLVDSVNDVSTKYAAEYEYYDGLKASVVVPPSDLGAPLVVLETKSGTQLVGAGVDHASTSLATYSAAFMSLPAMSAMCFAGELLAGEQAYAADGSLGTLVEYAQPLDSTAYTGQATASNEAELSGQSAFTVVSGTRRAVSTASGTPAVNYFNIDGDRLLSAAKAHYATLLAANDVITLVAVSTTAAGIDVADFFDAGFASTAPGVSAGFAAELIDCAYITHDDPRVAGDSMLDAIDRSVFSAQGTCIAVAGEALAHSLFSNLAFNSSAVLDGKTYLMTPEGIASFSSDQYPDAVLAGTINTENNMRCGQLRATASSSADSSTKMKLGGAPWYRYTMANTPGGARAVLGKGAQGRTATFVTRGMQGDVGEIVVDVSTDSRFKKG